MADTRNKSIEALREYLAGQDCSAIIIPTNDPHFGEYTPDHYKTREWLSGFTGSAGVLVVCMKSAALWTDSRYFIQAEEELAGTEIKLMKQGLEDTPSVEQWIKTQLEDEDDIVAIDQNLFTYEQYAKLVDELHPHTAVLVEDPFNELWEQRPDLKFNSIMNLDEKYTGESVSSKHTRITAAIALDHPYAYIITALDEIAWLCNIRGCDIEYNPVALAYAVLSEEKIDLFIMQEKLEPAAMSSLSSQGINFYPYEDFTSYLSKLPANTIRIFSRNMISAKNYLAATENLNHYSPVNLLMKDPVEGGLVNIFKAQKNEVELEGFRRANKEDAKAWEKLFAYIYENLPKGITEYDVAKKLEEFRSECPDYRGESFSAIVAYGPNAAIVHYSCKKESAAVLEPKGFLLIDAGAHYLYGTTDTTRTIALGELSQEEKDDYALVLKGMRQLSEAKFLKGTPGSSLDILARGPIMTTGKVYLHGTGHGIGHYLNVHEGPQSIRKEWNPITLMPGMVLSNEPAVYVEGKYGIRIENTIVVKPYIKNEGQEFYEFETISCVSKEDLN